MNRFRALTVTMTVGLVLLISAGVANANPGSGPVYPAWLPAWLYLPYLVIWNLGWELQNGINPLTGNAWGQ